MRRKIWLPLIFIMVVAYGGLALTLIRGNSPELGLDLQGGVSVVLAPTTDASGEQLDQALEIIRSRVDALGVAEPEITRQGDAIVVQLPGVKNRDRALELVGQTAELRFRPVLQDLTGLEAGDGGGDASTTTTAPADPAATTTTAPPATDTTVAEEAALGLVEGESAAAPLQEPTTTTTAPPTPPTTAPAPLTDPSQVQETPREDDQADATVILPGIEDDSLYQLGPTLATGRIVKTASADIQNGQWLVALEMRGGEDGIDKFNEIAASCYDQAPDPQVCPSGRLAIVLDSVVQSAPSINEPSYEADQISISGSFSESEAKDLALVLRYGSLPVELERQSVQTVSATLGDDSLRAGVIAGIVGLFLVALYMLVYYRALGLVVIVGLTVWASLMYTIISFLGESQGLALTLAGVTGIIVSIGVTVDSYVVYFERLKDEVKAGRTLRSSTERAFKRAFRTILAADTSAFIGAAVLWWLTVGSVRGFAFFLGLSTVLDVFVAWFFTRPTVTLLSRNRVFTDMPVLGVARGLAAPATAVPAERPVATAGVGR
ncbi:MAG TPA: protein translocase subunit SecD [Acidimicrobiales bacterium]|nr:protein translocase subunit SecD [Acidimicrobiales bacterium]